MNKYEAPCIRIKWAFTHLIYSVDGMACNEATAFKKCVALLMAMKYAQRYI